MKKGLILALIAMFFCNILHSSNTQFVVVIDPGHGGKDGGATRDKYREKDINLGVALVLGELIEKNIPNTKVVYTRKTDVFVPLAARADIANNANANLFISIHTNATAAKTTTVSGADTYILGLTKSAENLAAAKRENSVILLEDDYTTKYEGFDPNSPESNIIFEFMANKFLDQSLEFASAVQKGFKNVAKRNDRGVRQAGFLVLRETSMPSVLVELGFINNPQEARFLSTKDGQKSMASAIYSGFLEYKREFDKKQGSLTAVSPAPPTIDATISETGVLSVPLQDNIKTITKVELPNHPITTVSKTTNITEFFGKSTSNRTEYRIQILRGAELLQANSPQFKNLSPISYYANNGGYNYTFGLSTSRVEMQKLLKEAKAKFKDAFIAEFSPAKNTASNDQRIDVVTDTKVSENAIPVGTITYRVQFLYSEQKLPDNSTKFKGLSPVDYYEDNGYKYTYGSSTSRSEMEKILTQVRAKFKDAFIVTLKDGKRI